MKFNVPNSNVSFVTSVKIKLYVISRGRHGNVLRSTKDIFPKTAHFRSYLKSQDYL
jgi:hypothetical protein